jgi:hypothetical protein
METIPPLKMSDESKRTDEDDEGGGNGLVS